MKKTLSKVTLVAGLVYSVMLLGGCTSYYVQHLDSYFTSPNAAPVPTNNRQINDVRLSAGVTANPDNEISFDNGDYSGRSYYDTITRSYKTYADKDNIYVHFPYAQGSLLLDYTVTNHFFVYCKGNAGYIDDRFCGAVNVGIGWHFMFNRFTLGGYVTPGVNTLDQDLIASRSDNAEYAGIHVKSLEKNCANFGGGLQFTSNRKDDRLNFTWGIDVLLENYISFDYNEYFGTQQNYYEDDVIAYKLFYISPAFGAMKKIGNSQLNAIFHIGLPLMSNNNNYTYDSYSSDYSEDESNTQLLWKAIYTSIDLTYSFCFRKHGK